MSPNVNAESRESVVVHRTDALPSWQIRSRKQSANGAKAGREGPTWVEAICGPPSRSGVRPESIDEWMAQSGPHRLWTASTRRALASRLADDAAFAERAHVEVEP